MCDSANPQTAKANKHTQTRYCPQLEHVLGFFSQIKAKIIWHRAKINKELQKVKVSLSTDRKKNNSKLQLNSTSSNLYKLNLDFFLISGHESDN